MVMNHTVQEIVVGALVQWQEAQTYGVVIRIDGDRIHVLWDEEGPPSQFAAPPPLLRVNLQGQQVQVTTTGSNAVVTSPQSSTPPAWQCFVAEGGGVTQNFHEAALRPVPVTNPVERFRKGRVGSLKQYRLQEATRWYRQQHRYNALVSLGQVGVDIKPHQVSVAYKVVSNYPHRFLLCDEVGLGKTIEAGMILKELKARDAIQRILIIAPPNLVSQWQFEMKTKFNERFSVLNTATVSFIKNNQGYDGNPFAHGDRVICSSSWVANKRWAEQCSAVDWDLVIVDEAHHARRSKAGNRVTTTQLYQLIQNLSPTQQINRRGLLLLTATPMQLAAYEIYSLVELLDPTRFPTEEHFDHEREKLPELSRLVAQLDSQGFPPQPQTEAAEAEFSVDEDEIVSQVADWLHLEPAKAAERLSAGGVELKKIMDELTSCHFLSQLMMRNRKAVIGGFMPRVAAQWPVKPTEEETEAQEAVKDYVRYGFQRADSASGRNKQVIGFTMSTFQKLAASSIAAIKESLRKRRQRIQDAYPDANPFEVEELQQQLDEDNLVEDVVASGRLGSSPEEELGYIDQALEALERVRTDSKSQELVRQLETLFKKTPNEKVLIFTQYRETQRHLENLIRDKQWGVNLFHGQMNAIEKDRAVERFKTNAGSQVLISTEAGGEGRNFQFCHILVNYDLPWNPMRVEQRIGRVDRIGQDHPISIFNPYIENTIEERVLEVLHERIRVFENTVGGLDAILGEVEKDLEEIMRMVSEEAREKAAKEYGEKLEGRVDAAQDAENKSIDFVMDTSSMMRGITELITGQSSPVSNDDQERFIGQLLAGVGTHIHRNADTYTLTFNSRFVDEHKSLFVEGDKQDAVFRPDRNDQERVEFMVFGHPIVDAAVEQVLAEDYPGSTGARRIPVGEDLAPTAGWLFTYLLTISGPQPAEQLLPVFVSDAGDADPDLGRRLVERAGRFDSTEEEIDYATIPDNLSEVEPVANQAAIAEWQALQQQSQAQAEERIEQEARRLNDYFDYREQAARDKVEATETTLTEIIQKADSGQREARQIRPVWEANLRRSQEMFDQLPIDRQRRLEELKQSRPQVSYALRSLGRIEVVASD